MPRVFDRSATCWAVALKLSVPTPPAVEEYPPLIPIIAIDVAAVSEKESMRTMRSRVILFMDAV